MKTIASLTVALIASVALVGCGVEKPTPTVTPSEPDLPRNAFLGCTVDGDSGRDTTSLAAGPIITLRHKTEQTPDGRDGARSLTIVESETLAHMGDDTNADGSVSSKFVGQSFEIVLTPGSHNPGKIQFEMTSRLGNGVRTGTCLN